MDLSQSDKEEKLYRAHMRRFDLVLIALHHMQSLVNTNLCLEISKICNR